MIIPLETPLTRRLDIPVQCFPFVFILHSRHSVTSVETERDYRVLTLVHIGICLGSMIAVCA